VTTDKIAYTAMRCAALLAEVGRLEGEPVDRSGEGRLVEVYPDAAIREWGLWPREWDEQRVGYKGTQKAARARREQMVDSLLETTASWLILDSDLEACCRQGDDDLDALVSALVGRAVAQGHTASVGAVARARREGWIHLPLPGSLAALGETASG